MSLSSWWRRTRLSQIAQRELRRDGSPKPEPDLDTIPSMEGAGIGMDFLIHQLHDSGVNRTIPRRGDVVIVLSTDSMGMSIRSDHRYRATDRVMRYESDSPPSVWLVDRDGREELCNVGPLRTTPKAARTWIRVD